jgi:hypothetical protein
VSLSLCPRCCLWAAAAQGCRPWARRRSIGGTWWPPAAAAGTARGRRPDGGARHVFAWLPHRPPPSLVCFSPLSLSLSLLPLKLKDLIALPCKIRLLLYLKKLKIYKENSVLAWFQWQCWSDMLTRVCVCRPCCCWCALTDGSCCHNIKRPWTHFCFCAARGCLRRLAQPQQQSQIGELILEFYKRYSLGLWGPFPFPSFQTSESTCLSYAHVTVKFLLFRDCNW